MSTKGPSGFTDPDVKKVACKGCHTQVTFRDGDYVIRTWVPKSRLKEEFPNFTGCPDRDYCPGWLTVPKIGHENKARLRGLIK